MAKKQQVSKTVTKDKPKQIHVDLDQILGGGFPGLEKAYADANASDLFKFDKENKSEFVNERRVFDAARASKKPIKHNIFGLYRKQVGNKEYLYFLDLMVARDYFQNKVDWTRLVGKWDKPIITQAFGLDPASLKSDSAPEPGPIGDQEIEGLEEVHDYPWEQMRDQLIKWKEAGIINDKSIFYCIIGGRKYSVPYTWDQWLNLDMQSLELLGLHGKKYSGLMDPSNPVTLEAIKHAIEAEISKSLTNTPNASPRS